MTKFIEVTVKESINEYTGNLIPAYKMLVNTNRLLSIKNSNPVVIKDNVGERFQLEDTYNEIKAMITKKAE